jgi:Inner membrane component of T3SS, cytoplasmic domain
MTVTPKSLRIVRGLQQGVEVVLAPGSACVVGSQPQGCGVVLLDENVAARHFVLMSDGLGQVICTARDAPVRIDTRDLQPGESLVLADNQAVACGEAVLQIGPVGAGVPSLLTAAAAKPAAQRARERAAAALHRARVMHPVMLVLVLATAASLVVSAAYATVSMLASPRRLSIDDLGGAQQWLKGIAPAGSELQMVADEARQRLVVTGYVPTNYQRELVAASMSETGNPPHNEVVSVEQMMASLARMAQLEGVPCVATYRGTGRVGCTNEIVGADEAARLRTAAQQVKGLRDLQLQVAAPAGPAPAAAASSVPLVAEAPKPPVSLSKKFSVFMTKKGSYLVGPAGERYAEGDMFQGLMVKKIELDRVLFEHEQREYAMYVTQMK